MTTAAQTPKMTICPPGEASNAKLDLHVGLRIHMPVEARFTADGPESNGIDFSDYVRMGQFQRKLNCARKLETPSWVLDNSTLRQVLVAYMEVRANLPPAPNLSDSERLARAQKHLEAYVPMHEAILTKLSKKYVELKRQGVDAAVLRKLESSIEGLDTVLMLSKSIAAKVAMVANLYYRVGFNSTEVGAEFGLKPPLVRAIIWRLRRIAAKFNLGFDAHSKTLCAERARAEATRFCKACGAPRPKKIGQRYCLACSRQGKVRVTRKARRLFRQEVVAAFIALPPSIKGVASNRANIISSQEFLVLYESICKVRRHPERKACKHAHEICPALRTWAICAA